MHLFPELFTTLTPLINCWGLGGVCVLWEHGWLVAEKAMEWGELVCGENRPLLPRRVFQRLGGTGWALC